LSTHIEIYIFIFRNTHTHPKTMPQITNLKINILSKNQLNQVYLFQAPASALLCVSLYINIGHQMLHFQRLIFSSTLLKALKRDIPSYNQLNHNIGVGTHKCFVVCEFIYNYRSPHATFFNVNVQFKHSQKQIILKLSLAFGST